MKSLMFVFFLPTYLFSQYSYSDGMLMTITENGVGKRDSLFFSVLQQDTSEVRNTVGFKEFEAGMLKFFDGRAKPSDYDELSQKGTVAYLSQAVHQATLVTKLQLKNPSSMQFPEGTGRAYVFGDQLIVRFYIKAENGLGNLTTIESICTLKEGCICRLE